MKKQQNDPRQALLEFSVAVENFQEASGILVMAAQQLMQVSPEPAHQQVAQEAVKMTPTPEQIREVRDRIVACVKHHARERQLHWREIWSIAYRRLWEQYGFNAVARGLARGIAPLDACQRYGKLGKLLKVVEAI